MSYIICDDMDRIEGYFVEFLTQVSKCSFATYTYHTFLERERMMMMGSWLGLDNGRGDG